MDVIDRKSLLWNYMSEEIQELFEDGEIVLNFIHNSRNSENDSISDYSFMVFPFAKGYEGFLKKFFLDSGLIQEEDYYSDEIRIGRILNPTYKDKDSVFDKLCGKSAKGKEVSRKLWETWKKGRNLVFHYFPHNHRRLSYDQALNIINGIIESMNTAITKCELDIEK